MTLLRKPDHHQNQIQITSVINAWAQHKYRLASNKKLAAKVVCQFFQFADTGPENITSSSVIDWRSSLEERRLGTQTVYTYLSRLSAFFDWMIHDPRMGQIVRHNPVTSVRPPSPKPYANQKSRSLDDSQIGTLLTHMRSVIQRVSKPSAQHAAATRNYAMILWYLYTGLRREEIVRLRWNDLTWHDAETVSFRVTLKGGEVLTQQFTEPSAIRALWEYLEASGRSQTMQPDSPVWLSSARGKTKGKPLTSHAFDHALKKAAQECGIGTIHIHQFRHTFARLVLELVDGDIYQVQRELNHKNVATTRIYAQVVGRKKDRFSKNIAERFGRKEHHE